jgi:hypothetical protein
MEGRRTQGIIPLGRLAVGVGGACIVLGVVSTEAIVNEVVSDGRN